MAIGEWARDSVWQRPLEEEGVEPHPGPRVLNKNVNGLASEDRFTKFLNECARAHALSSVYAFTIQEHGLPPGRHQMCVRQASQIGLLWIAAYAPSGLPNYRGTGTAILIPLDMIERRGNETDADAKNRVIASAARARDGSICSLRTLIAGNALRITTAYAPPDSRYQERPGFFEKKLAGFVTPRTLLALDANCVPEPLLDLKRAGSSPYHNEGAEELAHLVAQHRLVDIAREQLGSAPFFTSHHATSAGITHTRIDQMYAPYIDSMIWTHESAHNFHTPPPSSTAPRDHVAIQLHLTVPSHERGNDLRFIDERVFEMPEEVGVIARIIKKYHDATQSPLPPLPDNALETLLKLKKEIKQHAICRTAALRKRDTDKVKQIKLRIKILTAMEDRGVTTESEYEMLSKCREELRNMKPEERTLNDTIEEQARVRGMGHDSGSAAMYRAISPRSSDHWIESLRVADWTDPSNPVWADPNTTPPVTEPKAKANELVRYYEPLFARKHTVPASVAAALDALREGPSVLPPTAQACGAAIRIEETLNTCKHLPTGKSPGPDRLPNAFYKNFADLLAPLLTAAFNEAHAKGELPPEMREGLISVLYKKKARDDPRNYRPITLLNGDYKIMMRILTERMNEAIKQFVSAMQNGFVPDSFIAENSHLLKLLQAYIELDRDDDEGAIFLFLDMEKAFDRCSWEFMHEALQVLGFPDEGSDPHPFRRWILLAYNSSAPPTRRMIVNGYLSDPFALGSGVAQGCPISPLLFIVFTEVLSRLATKATQADANGRSRANPDFEPLCGIAVNLARHFISQFADDTIFMLRFKDTGLTEWLIKTYCEATGGKENASKREVALVGRMAEPTHPLRARLPPSIASGIVAPGTPVRTLGVPFGDFDALAWWHSRYRVVKSSMTRLRSINQRSITGRNMILQSKFYGSFRYWLFTMIMPREIIDMIESDAKRFLWAAVPGLQADEAGSAAPTRRYVIEAASYLKQRDGGGGVMHWDSHVTAFYAQWVCRYLDPREAPWKSVLDYFVKEEWWTGRASILAKMRARESVSETLPPQLSYFKRAFSAFESLQLRRHSTHGNGRLPLPLFGSSHQPVPLPW